MVEISLSGSGEGPGWETSRPTLQRTFLPTPPGTGHSPAQLTAQGRRRRRRTTLSTDSHATPCWGRPAPQGTDRAGGWGRAACRGD